MWGGQYGSGLPQAVKSAQERVIVQITLATCNPCSITFIRIKTCVQPSMTELRYSSKQEAQRICDFILTLVQLPKEAEEARNHLTFESSRDFPYFPIPFKETEVTSALKGIEGCLACALQNLRDDSRQDRQITVNLEKTTAFLFQAYQATVDGYGKLDSGVKKYLKGE